MHTNTATERRFPVSSEHLIDCEKLTPKALRTKYKAEWNSHRAMLSRRKKGAKVSKKLLRFPDFLRALGPCPTPGSTVDRINCKDPSYAPGKIRWASKLVQARNRSNVIMLTDSDGTRRPLAEWAEVTKQSRHTLHSRRKRGFSDPLVIHGTTQHGSRNEHTVPQFPWRKGEEHQWEERYRRDAQGFPHPNVFRVETRAEYLFRIASGSFHAIRNEVERTVPPDCDGGPEHDELFKRWDYWQSELRRAARLLSDAARWSISKSIAEGNPHL
jgi:hypothetical protein